MAHGLYGLGRDGRAMLGRTTWVFNADEPFTAFLVCGCVFIMRVLCVVDIVGGTAGRSDIEKKRRRRQSEQDRANFARPAVLW